MKKQKWHVVVSFATEAFSEYLLQEGAKIDQPKILKKHGLLTNRMMIDNDILIDLNQVEQIQALLEKDTSAINRIYNSVESVTKVFLNFSKTLPSDFSKYTNKKLALELKKFISKYRPALSLIGIPTTIDLFLEDKVKDILQKVSKNPKLDYVSLAVAENKVNSLKEDRELNIIFKKFPQALRFIKNNRDIEKIRKTYPQFYSSIKKHLKKYNWLTTTLFLGEPMGYDDVIDSLLNHNIKSSKNKQKTFLNLDKIKKNDKKFINLLKKAIYFRTVRLEWLNQGCFMARPLLKEIARRLDLSYDELIYCLPDEIIISLLGDNKINKRVIKSRIKSYAMISDSKNKIQVITGKQVEIIKHKFCKKENGDEINGLIACHGFARGSVCLIMSRNDLSKIKKGEIMVCRLTTPDFVVAMKKAIAIVTDLGGITSHAAIVSRELSVPCIVGTKNATQVLKDGDLVEVDADNGVVKKLNN